MLFTGASIIQYLKATSLEGKFLLPSLAFEKGDLIAIERESKSGDIELTRNRIFTVHSDVLPKPYFIKQPKFFTTERLESITTEARVYQIINRIWALKDKIPEYVCFDKLNYLLINTFIEEAAPFSLSIEQKLRINDENALALASSFGKLLQLFHSNLPLAYFEADNDYCRYFSFSKPFPLGLSRNALFRLRFSDSPNQSDLACRLYKNFNHLEKVSAVWEAKNLIHGDIKINNFLFKDNNDIYLIDWEMADIGDPLWDLAGVLKMYFYVNYRGSFTGLDTLLRHCTNQYQKFYSTHEKQKLILYISSHILQDYYFSFDKDKQSPIISQDVIEWAFSALKDPEHHTHLF